MKPLASMLLLFVSIFFCLSFKKNGFSEEISLQMNENYLSSLLKDIKSAQKSIHCVMYLIKFDKKRKNDPSTMVLDELIQARKRGLNVEVIVDHNKKYWARKKDKEKIESKSKEALSYLKAGGVSVFLDSEDNITHSKVVIIDKKISYLGSSNWTYSALTRNNEANVRVVNTELARELRQQLDEIKVQTYDKTAK